MTSHELVPLITEVPVTNCEDALQSLTFLISVSGELLIVAREGEKSHNTLVKLARSEDIFKSLMHFLLFFFTCGCPSLAQAVLFFLFCFCNLVAIG